jgi:hypothetical protein
MISFDRTLMADWAGKLVIAAALLACAVRPAAAQDSPCAGVPQDEYQLNVIKDVAEPRLNHELGRTDIGDLTFHSARSSVLGLTASQLEVEYSAAFRYLPTGDGFCFWTDSVTVTLHYRTVDVYVAAEYPVASCPYNAILGHEMEHVAIAHEHLDYYTPNIKNALVSLTIPKAQTPALVGSLDQAQSETIDEIGRLLEPAVETMQRAMIAAQDVIDSEKSYRRVRAQCSDW